MDRIIIIDDKAIKDDLEAFLLANQEHILLNSDMDEVTLGTNPILQEIIALYEKKYKVKIQSRDTIRFYRLNDILRLESHKKYTKLVLINGKVNMINESLTEIEKQLTSFPFFRTHKDHIINLHYITGIKDAADARVILSTGDVIPLSQKEKELIIETLNKFIK